MVPFLSQDDDFSHTHFLGRIVIDTQDIDIETAGGRLAGVVLEIPNERVQSLASPGLGTVNLFPGEGEKAQPNLRGSVQVHEEPDGLAVRGKVGGRHNGLQQGATGWNRRRGFRRGIAAFQR